MVNYAGISDNTIMLSRRQWLQMLCSVGFLNACGGDSSSNRGERITIGVLSYSQGNDVLKQFADFKDYLAEKAQTFVEIDPAFNENRALERIRSRTWSLVFAPPGLAAIAMQEAQYQPLFPLEGVENLRSIFVVRKDSPLKNLHELAGKSVVLGLPGSATGYYIPLFNLYGLTLAELSFAPTPKAGLEEVISAKAAAAALSQQELETSGLGSEVRILFADSHLIPAGVLLIGPSIERNRAEQVKQVLKETPETLTRTVGYLSNSLPPEYSYMFSVVKRVRTIFPSIPDLVRLKPARLYGKEKSTSQGT
jgi:phosphonate transport system substrate-binding protein